MKAETILAPVLLGVLLASAALAKYGNWAGSPGNVQLQTVSSKSYSWDGIAPIRISGLGGDVSLEVSKVDEGFGVVLKSYNSWSG
jgi:hypothetical protein